MKDFKFFHGYTEIPILAGFSGRTYLEAGYVYAPYVPMYTEPSVPEPPTWTRRINSNIATRYATRTINPRFYVNIRTRR